MKTSTFIIFLYLAGFALDSKGINLEQKMSSLNSRVEEGRHLYNQAQDLIRETQIAVESCSKVPAAIQSDSFYFSCERSFAILKYKGELYREFYLDFVKSVQSLDSSLEKAKNSLVHFIAQINSKMEQVVRSNDQVIQFFVNRNKKIMNIAYLKNEEDARLKTGINIFCKSLPNKIEAYQIGLELTSESYDFYKFNYDTLMSLLTIKGIADLLKDKCPSSLPMNSLIHLIEIAQTKVNALDFNKFKKKNCIGKSQNENRQCLMLSENPFSIDYISKYRK